MKSKKRQTVISVHGNKRGYMNILLGEVKCIFDEEHLGNSIGYEIIPKRERCLREMKNI